MTDKVRKQATMYTVERHEDLIPALDNYSDVKIRLESHE